MLGRTAVGMTLASLVLGCKVERYDQLDRETRTVDTAVADSLRTDTLLPAPAYREGLVGDTLYTASPTYDTK